MDKEKGEALVFSGRQFPFITELADINEFDHGKYEILEMNKRLSIVEECIAVDLEINENQKKKSRLGVFEKACMTFKRVGT